MGPPKRRGSCKKSIEISLDSLSSRSNAPVASFDDESLNLVDLPHGLSGDPFNHSYYTIDSSNKSSELRDFPWSTDSHETTNSSKLMDSVAPLSLDPLIMDYRSTRQFISCTSDLFTAPTSLLDGRKHQFQSGNLDWFERQYDSHYRFFMEEFKSFDQSLHDDHKGDLLSCVFNFDGLATQHQKTLNSLSGQSTNPPGSDGSEFSSAGDVPIDYMQSENGSSNHHIHSHHHFPLHLDSISADLYHHHQERHGSDFDFSIPSAGVNANMVCRKRASSSAHNGLRSIETRATMSGEEFATCAVGDSEAADSSVYSESSDSCRMTSNLRHQSASRVITLDSSSSSSSSAEQFDSAADFHSIISHSSSSNVSHRAVNNNNNHSNNNNNNSSSTNSSHHVADAPHITILGRPSKRPRTINTNLRNQANDDHTSSYKQHHPIARSSTTTESTVAPISSPSPRESQALEPNAAQAITLLQQFASQQQQPPAAVQGVNSTGRISLPLRTHAGLTPQQQILLQFHQQAAAVAQSSPVSHPPHSPTLPPQQQQHQNFAAVAAVAAAAAANGNAAQWHQHLLANPENRAAMAAVATAALAARVQAAQQGGGESGTPTPITPLPAAAAALQFLRMTQQIQQASQQSQVTNAYGGRDLPAVPPGGNGSGLANPQSPIIKPATLNHNQQHSQQASHTQQQQHQNQSSPVMAPQNSPSGVGVPQAAFLQQMIVAAAAAQQQQQQQQHQFIQQLHAHLQQQAAAAAANKESGQNLFPTCSTATSPILHPSSSPAKSSASPLPLQAAVMSLLMNKNTQQQHPQQQSVQRPSCVFPPLPAAATLATLMGGHNTALNSAAPNASSILISASAAADQVANS